MANPATLAGLKELLKYLAIGTGADMVAGIGESIRGKTPFEKAMENQASYATSMLPDIYNEARGLPSMATRNLMREAGAGINREEQSFMASQMRANPNMTKLSTPTRTGSTRFTQMKQEVNRNILGNAQQNARQQLLGMGQNATAMVGLAEQRREERRSAFNKKIMNFLGYYEGVNDPQEKSRLDEFMALWKQTLGTPISAPSGQFRTGMTAIPVTNEPRF